MSSWGNEAGDEFIARTDRGKFAHQKTKYGASVKGIDLQVYVPQQWTPKRTLVIGGIHGEEADTTSVLSYALRSIKPEFLRCGVILCANPDGMIEALRSNANGVDLNRNFPCSTWQSEVVPHRWDAYLPRETMLSPGSAAGSEPEVAALISLIEHQKIEQIIMLHSPIGCIDYEQEEPWPLVQELANLMNLPLKQNIGYPTPGSMSSWATEQSIKFVTLELPSQLSLFQMRKTHGPVIQKILLGKLSGL
jgi:murein peptide amidase A